MTGVPFLKGSGVLFSPPPVPDRVWGLPALLHIPGQIGPKFCLRRLTMTVHKLVKACGLKRRRLTPRCSLPSALDSYSTRHDTGKLYRIWRFIAVCTEVRHRNLSQIRSIEITSLQFYWHYIIFPHTHSIPIGVFPWDFPIKIVQYTNLLPSFLPNVQPILSFFM